MEQIDQLIRDDEASFEEKDPIITISVSVNGDEPIYRQYVIKEGNTYGIGEGAQEMADLLLAK